MAITTIQTFAEYTTVSPSSFIPIVDVNDNVNLKSKKIAVGDLRKYFFTSQNLSRSFASHTPGFYYFGDNSDGPGNFSGSITALRTRISSSFSSSLNGPPVIKNFSSLFVSQSVVLSPPTRCRGMLIFVDGDATISGSIRMSARGAVFTFTDASFTVVNPPYLGDYWSTLNFPSSSYLSRVFATGANGGSGAPSPLGLDGFTGTGGRSGGGGAGSNFGTPAAGSNGAAGTGFSGGSGGGGSSAPAPSPAGNPGSTTGGAGGNAASPGGGGGAGNPGGTPNGGNGTGGLLILIVRGNLKIGPNASITANGTDGGAAASPTLGGGGGGSGGGIIYIYYGGTLTNNGTVTANGGTRGSGGNLAGNGGAGTVVLSKLSVAFPIAN